MPAKIVFAAICAVAVSTPVVAQDAAENAVDVRQSLLTLMRHNYGPLAGMARDKVDYDAALAEKSATRLEQLVAMLGDAFAYDTRGYEGKTDALDDIWAAPEEFASKVAAANEAADALAKVAGNGNGGEFKAAVGAMGQSCGGCHDEFKKDD